ncbi:MAG: type VI secretion system-associated FHA domain protein TagH [Gammaproteobacteria bacterium]
MPLRLRVISDSKELPRNQRVREFPGVGGTIGRSPDNDWVLPDERRYVSGRHAMIDYQGGAYYLVDTSRNGVYVNGADTPVGQGHPQRLFDGDQLRIGEFEIAVDISASDQDDKNDGMRDSIVRAQLVPEDESIELQLVAEDKLTRDSTLQRHLSPPGVASKRAKGAARTATQSTSQASSVAVQAGSTARQTARPPSRSAARPVAVPDPPAKPAPARSTRPRTEPGTGDSEQRAMAIFVEAAGIEPDAIAGHSAAEVLAGSGKLLRVMVSGLMELLRDRSHMKDTFRLPQTVMQAAQNNPLKFSPSVDEALRYLLNDRSEGAYLSAEDAVRAGFRDVRQHERALVQAMLQAVQDYIERFDPDELKGRFDKGLKRGGLLASANKLKYWELYEESYPALTQRDDGGPPQLFTEEFARAYIQELEGQQKKNSGSR